MSASARGTFEPKRPVVKIGRLSCACLWLVFAACCANGLAGEPWMTFESRRDHFRVLYPPSWHRRGTEGDNILGPNPDALDIVNFPLSETVKGVSITPSGAMIMVTSAPPGMGLADWSRRLDTDFYATGERDLPVENAAPMGCKSLREVTARYNVGVGEVRQLETAYYCSTDFGLFGVFLTNWEGNPKQKELQSLARQIVLTLRHR